MVICCWESMGDIYIYIIRIDFNRLDLQCHQAWLAGNSARKGHFLLENHGTKSEPWEFGAIKNPCVLACFFGSKWPKRSKRSWKKGKIPLRHLVGRCLCTCVSGRKSVGGDPHGSVFLQRIFQLTPENHGDYDALTTASRVVSRISRKGSTMNHECFLSFVP